METYEILTFNLVVIFFICAMNPAVVLGWLQNKDLTALGSKNPGATNTYRILGRRASIIVFLVDFFKPMAAFYLLIYLNSTHPLTLSLLPLCSVLGHCYSPMLKFKGGKGVATFLGAITYMNFVWGLILISIWLAVYYISRTSWKSSLFACSSALCVIPTSIAPFIIAPVAVVILRHRDNFARSS